MVGCEHITWEDNSASCPAQLAYKLQKSVNGQLEFVQIWGTSVTEALKDKTIQEKDVLQWLKPALFSCTDSRSFHEVQLENRLSRLKETAARHKVPNLAQYSSLDSRKLYADLLRHAYSYVLQKVCKALPTLDRIRRSGSPVLYEMIEVALPVPAGALAIQELMVLEAAKQAALPNPFPVAEPAAAIAHMMQHNFERVNYSGGQSRSTTGTVLLLDAGEGSLDAIVCTIRSESNPVLGHGQDGSLELKVRHILKEAVKGMSRWNGGSSINEAFREWVNTIFENEITRLSQQSNVNMPKDEIVDRLVREFEDKKRRFTGAHGTAVGIVLPGAPELSVPIPREQMIKFFNLQLLASFDLIEQQIERLKERSHELGRHSQLDQIILVGGGNESEYIQEEIRERYISRMSVIRSDNQGHTSTAKGGLLIALDQSFIAERVLLHNYFFKWDHRVSEMDPSPDENSIVTFDEAQRVMMVRDVSRIVLKAGDPVPWDHIVRLQGGVRNLRRRPRPGEEDFDHKTRNFTIKEEFFMSDESSADGLSVNYLPNDFHRIGTLTFEIPLGWCETNGLRIQPNNDEYWQLDYQVSVRLIGMNMNFSITIPEHGVFKKGEENLPAFEKEGHIKWNESGGFWKV